MKKVTYILTLPIISGICEENKWVNIKKVLSLKNCCALTFYKILL